MTASLLLRSLGGWLQPAGLARQPTRGRTRLHRVKLLFFLLLRLAMALVSLVSVTCIPSTQSQLHGVGSAWCSDSVNGVLNVFQMHRLGTGREEILVEFRHDILVHLCQITNVIDPDLFECRGKLVPITTFHCGVEPSSDGRGFDHLRCQRDSAYLFGHVGMLGLAPSLSGMIVLPHGVRDKKHDDDPNPNEADCHLNTVMCGGCLHQVSAQVIVQRDDAQTYFAAFGDVSSLLLPPPSSSSPSSSWSVAVGSKVGLLVGAGVVGIAVGVVDVACVRGGGGGGHK